MVKFVIFADLGQFVLSDSSYPPLSGKMTQFMIGRNYASARSRKTLIFANRKRQ
jgi:hypothetical protein